MLHGQGQWMVHLGSLSERVPHLVGLLLSYLRKQLLAHSWMLRVMLVVIHLLMVRRLGQKWVLSHG